MKNIKSIGIDFGGTSIKFGVVSGKEIIATSPRLSPKDFSSSEELIRTIADKVNQLKSEHDNVVAIGCGVPGFVEFSTGTVHNLTNVPGWTNIPLKQELETRTDLPTVVENDANAMAIAEWKLGAARDYHHAVCLTLGTGVGAGIIANGAIIRGAQYAAGELGQTSIHYAGRKGNYNNPGALEAYIGNNQFAADTHADYLAVGIIKELSDCSPENLAEAAENGCEIALSAWEGFAQKLATSLASTCWLLNPEIIVIGGGLSNAGEILFTPLIKHLHGQLSGPFKDHLKVVPAEFSNNAGILGTAALALAEISH
jgi:glucokinase